MAALDHRTCPRCGSLDGQVFEVTESMPGENFPPMHPRCRCTIVPTIGEQYGKRTSKIEGKRVKIPQSMTYTEWKKIYVDKEKTLNEWIVPRSFQELQIYIGKLDNLTVRKWYIWHDERIHEHINPALSLEEKARQAFNLRNTFRTQARELMADKKNRAELESKYPNKTFEELISDKMARKNITRQEAVEDIFKTARKSNTIVNKKLGIE